MTARKHCAYTACGLPLKADKAQFEVRAAAELQAREDQAPGTYCNVECWEAQKAVNQFRKCFGDAEIVLSERHAITG